MIRRPARNGDAEPALRYVDSPRLDRRTRLGIVAAIVLLHVALVLAIVRGLGGISATLQKTGLDRVASAFDVPLPPPPPAARPVRQTEPEGAKAQAAAKAKAKAISAPRPRVPNPRAPQAARVSSTGDEVRSGAARGEQGTGADGEGIGTGSGDSGTGGGGRYVARKAVKIAGDITSARDYPAEGRDERIGRSVVIALTVGTDGRVHGCRVYRASGDAQADRITCQLATERFRFRPALDQDGEPIESVYGWQQRWFRP